MGRRGEKGTEGTGRERGKGREDKREKVKVEKRLGGKQGEKRARDVEGEKWKGRSERARERKSDS